MVCQNPCDICKNVGRERSSRDEFARYLFDTSVANTSGANSSRRYRRRYHRRTRNQLIVNIRRWLVARASLRRKNFDACIIVPPPSCLPSPGGCQPKVHLLKYRVPAFENCSGRPEGSKTNASRLLNGKTPSGCGGLCRSWTTIATGTPGNRKVLNFTISPKLIQTAALMMKDQSTPRALSLKHLVYPYGW
jgi:hypothetical protein